MRSVILYFFSANAEFLLFPLVSLNPVGQGNFLMLAAFFAWENIWCLHETWKDNRALM